MDTVTLLLKLAQCTHHNSTIVQLISEQPEKIQTAFATNDAELLKAQISTEQMYHSTIMVHS